MLDHRLKLPQVNRQSLALLPRQSAGHFWYSQKATGYVGEIGYWALRL
jgi:hypothetical protein